MAWLKPAFVLLFVVSSLEHADGTPTNNPLSQMGGHTYRIRNRGTGLYMSVQYSSTEASWIIQDNLQTNENRDSQTWHLFSKDNDFFIVSKRSGYYLHGDHWMNQQMLTDSSQPLMIWRIQPDRDGYYTIQSTAKHLYLNVFGYYGKYTEPANHKGYLFISELMDDSNRQYQQWAFEVEECPPVLKLNQLTKVHAMEGRSYRIRNRGSGLVMSAQDFSTVQGSWIVQNDPQTDENQNSQIWNLFSKENGYVIVNKRSGYYLYGSFWVAQQILTHETQPYSIWRIHSDRDGYYTIQGSTNHLYLGVFGYYGKYTNPVEWLGYLFMSELMEDANRKYQQWAFEEEEESSLS